MSSLKRIILFVSLWLISCNFHSRKEPEFNWGRTLLLNDFSNVQVVNNLIINYKKKDKKFLHKKLDSCNRVWKFNRNRHFVSDSIYLNEEFIHKNDSLTQVALKMASWRNTITPAIYRDYIVPYKLDYEFVDNWRSILLREYLHAVQDDPILSNLDSLYNFHMQNTYPSLKSNDDLVNHFMVRNNFAWLKMAKEGDCHGRCRLVIYHLRAAGAPATFDFIPNWGNRPYSKHAYVGLANRKKQLPFLLENTNDTTKLVNKLNAVMTLKNAFFFKANELPDKLTIQYEKTIPKVYRQTWNINTEIENLISSTPSSEIIGNLVNPYHEDVTDQYLNTSKVKISRNLMKNSSIAYLTTFDVKGWIPVAYAPYDVWGRAIFEKMGKNILYLPILHYENGKRKYGNPFIIENDGRKTILKGTGETMDLHLIRKFPLFSYSASHVTSLKNASIEASNDADFKSFTVLHILEEYPFYTQEIKINSAKKFRYIRIRNGGEKLRLAQMECLIDSLGIIVKKEDVRLRKKKLSKKYRKVFDKDLNTYLVSRDIRMDLGKPYKISQINITPRNDTNNIIPGKLYELFYWNKGWKSAGKKRAEKYFLDYCDAPAGTMYWLKCLTNGKEERVFTYKNGKQFWW